MVQVGLVAERSCQPAARVPSARVAEQRAVRSVPPNSEKVKGLAHASAQDLPPGAATKPAPRGEAGSGEGCV